MTRADEGLLERDTSMRQSVAIRAAGGNPRLQAKFLKNKPDLAAIETRPFTLAVALASAFGLCPFGYSVARAEATVRIAGYSDGNEGEILTHLLNRFEARNKDIEVVLDQVPYRATTETLPVQLASGQGPDVARVVDLGGIAQYAVDLRRGPLGH
jgi:maltose-binding protein MalE